MFITTPNRTLYSWLSVIIIGETFNLIPKGTHELEKFICPHELQSILEINCKYEINYHIIYICCIRLSNKQCRKYMFCTNSIIYNIRVN